MEVNESTEVNEFMNVSQRCRSRLMPLFSYCILKLLYSHSFPFTWKEKVEITSSFFPYSISNVFMEVLFEKG